MMEMWLASSLYYLESQLCCYRRGGSKPKKTVKDSRFRGIVQGVRLLLMIESLQSF